MNGAEFYRGVTEVTETSMLLGAWYADAREAYFSNSSASVVGKIFRGAVISTTVWASLKMQDFALKNLEIYTRNFQSCTPAANGGYAIARILANRGEGALVSRDNNGGKEALLALVGSVAIFALQVLRGKTTTSDFTKSFLVGVAFGFCKSKFDDLLIKTMATKEKHTYNDL